MCSVGGNKGGGNGTTVIASSIRFIKEIKRKLERGLAWANSGNNEVNAFIEGITS